MPPTARLAPKAGSKYLLHWSTVRCICFKFSKRRIHVLRNIFLCRTHLPLGSSSRLESIYRPVAKRTRGKMPHNEKILCKAIFCALFLSSVPCSIIFNFGLCAPNQLQIWSQAWFTLFPKCVSLIAWVCWVVIEQSLCSALMGGWVNDIKLQFA